MLLSFWTANLHFNSVLLSSYSILSFFYSWSGFLVLFLSSTFFTFLFLVSVYSANYSWLCFTLTIPSLHFEYKLSIAINILAKSKFFFSYRSLFRYNYDWSSLLMLILCSSFLDKSLSSLLNCRIFWFICFSNDDDSILSDYFYDSITSLSFRSFWLNFLSVWYLLRMSDISGYWSE